MILHTCGDKASALSQADMKCNSNDWPMWRCGVLSTHKTHAACLPWHTARISGLRQAPSLEEGNGLCLWQASVPLQQKMKRCPHIQATENASAKSLSP